MTGFSNTRGALLRLALSCCLLLSPGRSLDAQSLVPFVGGFAPRTVEQPVAAREPWSAAEHAAAVQSAIGAAAALPESVRTRMRMRLATTLDKMGDRAEEARVLRQAIDDRHGSDVSFAELAQLLVETGESDELRKLASETSGIEQQQVLSGMLRGAVKTGNLDIGLEALALARQLSHQSTFALLTSPSVMLADALSKSGRHREALSAFPMSGVPDGRELPRIATAACAADPSLSDRAGDMVAVTALKIAGASFARSAPVEQVRAFAACRGEAAARRLIAMMPIEVAEKVSFVGSVPSPSPDASQLASDASREADKTKASRLFAEATAELDAEASQRGTSREARQRFDTATSQVAISMARANRSDAALALVAKLPAMERLPILFTLARQGADPMTFVAAIDSDFTSQPALVAVEAGEIRALRAVLPLGSPIYPKIEPWLDALPRDDVGPQMTRPSIPFKTADTNVRILAALTKAAPSIAVVQRVLLEAKQGQIAQAIGEAKTLTLLPRESGSLDLIRTFLGALPDQMLTSFPGLAPEGLDVRQAIALSPVDGLLVAVERTALSAKNLGGGREAFAALDPGSPAKRYAATLLAIDEARMGLPRTAIGEWAQISDPSESFAILLAIVAVRPSA